MTLTVIGLMCAGALLVWVLRSQRPTALLVLSVVGLYMLQPVGFEIALPTATLLLVIAVWWLITPRAARNDTITALVLIASAALAVLLRVGIQTPVIDGVVKSRLDDLLQGLRVLPPLAAVAVAALGAGAVIPKDNDAARRRIATGFVLVIIALLVVLKLPALHDAIPDALARYSQTAFLDWQWIGFSYIAFRLMHVLLDFRNQRLRPMTLRDFALYVTFFPALVAGPIDRAEHFVSDLARPIVLDTERLIAGGTRIGMGLFKKFVVADSLARIALNATLVEQSVRGMPWTLWLMLYAYSFQIFFDFSGYSDIAIGIGILAGIKLPENFNAPYLKPNITAFWNSWRITLASWFRTYFFTPLSRALMATQLRKQRLLIILITQVSTMMLIGLWHGITLNFVLWGLWHGLGLWLHRWFTDHAQGWHAYVQARPKLASVVQVLSVVGTFHFVALGWVFFALPDLQHIGLALVKLAGFNG